MTASTSPIGSEEAPARGNRKRRIAVVQDRPFAPPPRTAMARAHVNPDLKRHAEAVLARLGLTPFQAVNMLYAQILLTKGLPFEARIPNKETAAAMNADRKSEVRKAKNAAEIIQK